MLRYNATWLELILLQIQFQFQFDPWCVVFVCWNEGSFNMWSWLTSFCGLDVGLVCEFAYARGKSFIENIFCFGKS
jgi:hypothetical protein